MNSHNGTISVVLIWITPLVLLWIHDAYTGSSFAMGGVSSAQIASAFLLADLHTALAVTQGTIGAAFLRLDWFLAIIVLLLGGFAAVFIFINKKAKERLAIIERQKAELELQHLHKKAILEELNEIKDQLMRHEKMSSLGQMTSGIAHELNNPLNFISGGIQALETNIHELLRICRSQSEQKTDEIEDEVKSLLNSIHKGVNRIAKIILSLKTFSSPQADMQRLHLGEPLDMALEILQSKIKSANVVIRNGLNTSAEIFGNSSELMQVFTNLIDNSIFAMANRDTRELAITSFLRDRFVVVAIRDTGGGIPEEIQPRITDAFFTTKPEGIGTGLGLSISKRIIEKHNGEFSFKSVYGVGTTFEISLPVTDR